MPGPTFQLLLDFSKHSVWPFENITDHKDMSKLVSELRLGVDEELSRERLKEIIQEYHRRFRPRRIFEDERADKFSDLVMEVWTEFGDILTKDALSELNRRLLAPKRPRNIVRF